MTTSQPLGPTSADFSDLATLRVSDTSSAQDEAKFQSIMKQSAGESAARTDGFDIDPNAINAADDSWVNVVAKVELLQNGNLEKEQREVLVREITENWRNFQSQSGSIVRQLESYISTK